MTCRESQDFLTNRFAVPTKEEEQQEEWKMWEKLISHLNDYSFYIGYENMIKEQWKYILYWAPLL